MEPIDPRQPQKWTAIAVIVVMLGLLIAAVFLAYAGWQPESITGLLVGLGVVAGTILPLLGKVLTVTAQQTVTLSEIHEQTNGNMAPAMLKAARQANAEQTKHEANAGVSLGDSNPV